jgi:hypothetical protein
VNEKILEDGRAVPQDSKEGIRISAVVEKLRERLDELPEPYRMLLAETLDLRASVPQQPFLGLATVETVVPAEDRHALPAAARTLQLQGGVIQADLVIPSVSPSGSPSRSRPDQLLLFPRRPPE